MWRPQSISYSLSEGCDVEAQSPCGVRSGLLMRCRYLAERTMVAMWRAYVASAGRRLVSNRVRRSLRRRARSVLSPHCGVREDAGLRVAYCNSGLCRP